MGWERRVSEVTKRGRRSSVAHSHPESTRALYFRSNDDLKQEERRTCTHARMIKRAAHSTVLQNAKV